MLGWPVAQLYTEKCLKQEDKDRISSMIDEICEITEELDGIHVD